MTTTRALLTLLFITGLLVTAGPAAHAETITPDTIGGLTAWYRASDLGLNTGAKVGTWPDASENGHDLVDDATGLHATYDAVQANNHPAVVIRKGNSHSVTNPFELADHTIFVVFRTRLSGRALFRSDADEFSGVVLRADELHDRLVYSSGQGLNYGSVQEPSRSFGITTLGRQAGLLYSFVNGVDVSAGAEYEGTVRVGKFFHLTHTRFSKADGDGLSIAEMIFYNRFLSDQELAQVTRYLAESYEIELGAALEGEEAAEYVEVVAAPASLAQLSTTIKTNVNEAMVAVPWDRQDELDPPFRHDAKESNTRLICDSDETRVRLHVSLPLSADVDGVNIRLLFRVNGALFLRGEGRTGPFGGPGGAGKASVAAEVLTTLNAGDYVEVVALRAGAAGMVTIDPDEAVFIAEVK
jgi:hypothetical protein